MSMWNTSCNCSYIALRNAVQLGIPKTMIQNVRDYRHTKFNWDIWLPVHCVLKARFPNSWTGTTGLITKRPDLTSLDFFRYENSETSNRQNCFSCSNSHSGHTFVIPGQKMNAAGLQTVFTSILLKARNLNFESSPNFLKLITVFISL
jgi:hypothetical protein